MISATGRTENVKKFRILFRHDTGTLRGACRFWGINRFRHQTGEGDRVGKGGGRAHTPVEAKDNLKSTQMMSVIDAIVRADEGPVKGLQSILVNKTR